MYNFNIGIDTKFQISDLISSSSQKSSLEPLQLVTDVAAMANEYYAAYPFLHTAYYGVFGYVVGRQTLLQTILLYRYKDALLFFIINLCCVCIRIHI